MKKRFVSLVIKFSYERVLQKNAEPNKGMTEFEMESLRLEKLRLTLDFIKILLRYGVSLVMFIALMSDFLSQIIEQLIIP